MKITTNGFQSEIKTNRINFAVLRKGEVEVESIIFKSTLFSNEPIETVWIGTEESRVELTEWFRRMLSQKLILVEPSGILQDFFHEHLFVNDVSLPYITKTIFQILQRLLPENLTLESITYE